MNEFDYSIYCNRRLFEEIKELNDLGEEYKEEMRYIKRVKSGEFIDKDIAHAVYESVFCKYVLELINKKNLTEKEQEILDRSFKLIEELANHEEARVRNVADVSFIEPLLDQIRPMKRIEDYVLPKSLEMARDIAHNQFGYDPVTWEKRKRK